MQNVHNRSAELYVENPFGSRWRSNKNKKPRLDPLGSRSHINNTRFRLIHLFCDATALVLAWLLTFHVRLWLNGIMPATLTMQDLEAAAPPLSGMLALWIFAALWLRIYRSGTSLQISSAVIDILESVVTMSTLAIVLIFFFRAFGVEKSRSFVPIFAVVSLLCLIPSFYLAVTIAGVLGKKWPTAKRVAVVGDGEEAYAVIASLRRSGGSSVEMLGVIVDEIGNTIPALGDTPVLGASRQLAELVNKERIDRLIIAQPGLTHAEFLGYEQIANRMGITVSCPIGWANSMAKLSVGNDYGLQLMNIEAPSGTHHESFFKRPLDFVLSLILLILFAPVILVLAILVKLTSPGPVFYCSTRVGRSGRYFTFWKFRSMYQGMTRAQLQAQNEKNGHLFKIRNDPRVTPFGKFMRRHSLDELPQLFNVLRGDMSIVGPRPLPVEDLNPDGLSSEYKVWAEERARVRPGITGLWQTSGRSNLTFEQMVEFDIQYLRACSFRLDMKIILQTPIVMLSGRGAY